jgi:2-isopropylmalate synthase
MGYDLDDATLESVFTRFKDLADRKKNITGADLEALVLQGQNLVRTEGACQLVSHVINAGQGLPNTAYVKLERDGETMEDVAIGSGPLDAAFKAVNRMLNMEVRLDSYGLTALTDGEDAIGEAIVKVGIGDGESYTGTGLSTDVIEASIRAYVNGINKIVESGDLSSAPAAMPTDWGDFVFSSDVY